MEKAEFELETGDITCFLAQWNRGETQALHGLMDRVYLELKDMARKMFVQECGNRTLTPTALINEVFLRFVNTSRFKADNRAQFFWFAGRLMRRILVDHARLKLTHKRGLGETVLCLDQVMGVSQNTGISLTTLISLDQALVRLKQLDQRQAQIIEMRYFAGLSLAEIAELLTISPTTIKREWRMARAWLAARLKSNTITTPQNVVPTS